MSLCWLCLLVTASSIWQSGAALPTAAEFLQQNCSAYGVHDGLVQEVLRPYLDGLSLRGMLQSTPPDLYASGHPNIKPLVKVHGVNISLHGSYIGGFDGAWLPRDQYIPMLQDLTQYFLLPEAYILMWEWDTPPSPLDTSGNAWGGYCSVRGERPSLLLPIRYRPVAFDTQAKQRSGRHDTRLGKAVFLGSATGWDKGHRHSLSRLRLTHPDQVHAGLSDWQGCGQCNDVDPEELPTFVLPALSLQQQVDSFKYIVQANGNCAAMRLRDMLSSDSAVMMISSNELEWFYPLLLPYRHYIPVEASISPSPKHEKLNLVDVVQWAEANPDVVSGIVRDARKFAEHHLSELGQTCYMARLLEGYAKLLVHDADAASLNMTDIAELDRRKRHRHQH